MVNPYTNSTINTPIHAPNNISDKERNFPSILFSAIIIESTMDKVRIIILSVFNQIAVKAAKAIAACPLGMKFVFNHLFLPDVLAAFKATIAMMVSTIATKAK